MTPARVAEAFAFQAEACRSLGSPFMGRLCDLFATRSWPDGPITARIFDWPGELGPRFQSVPLRLAGALHALHLSGNAHLAPVYPPHAASDDALWSALGQVFATERSHLDHWLDSPPQTNEVRRSAALIAAGHWLAERHSRPMRLSELGASGGLNLMWDRFGLRIGAQHYGSEGPVTLTPDWTGPMPPHTAPTIVERAGVDINPLRPDTADGALRLQAYLWPDQPERLALTRAAIALNDVTVAQADAIDWLAPRLAHQPGRLHLIYSTIAWQYFPAAAQKNGTALIEAAGQSATEDTPLAWLSMENDGGPRGAALTLRLWPGDATVELGRADFHGRWIDWQPREVG